MLLVVLQGEDEVKLKYHLCHDSFKMSGKSIYATWAQLDEGEDSRSDYIVEFSHTDCRGMFS